MPCLRSRYEKPSPRTIACLLSCIADCYEVIFAQFLDVAFTLSPMSIKTMSWMSEIVTGRPTSNIDTLTIRVHR